MKPQSYNVATLGHLGLYALHLSEKPLMPFYLSTSM